MKKIFILLISFCSLFLESCEKITVGYMNFDHIKFRPDSMVIELPSDPGELQNGFDSIPLQSLPILGIDGTPPVKCSITAVTNERGTFRIEPYFSLGPQNKIQVAYYYSLPEGVYWLDLRVYNEGYSKVIPGIYHVIIRKK